MLNRTLIACLLLLGTALVAAPAAWPDALAAQDADDDDDADDADGDGDDDDEVADPDDQDIGDDEPGGNDPDGGGMEGNDPGDTDGGDDGDDGDDGMGGGGSGGDDGGMGGGASGGDDDGGDDANGGDGDDDASGGAGDDDAPAGGGGGGGGAGNGGGDDDDGAAGDDDDDDRAPGGGGSGGGGGAGGGSGGGDDDAPGADAGDDDDRGSADDDRGAADDDRGNEDINDDREGAGDAFEAADQEVVTWEITIGDTEAERADLDAREGIDTDSDGFRYRRGEFIALDLSDADLAELKADGFEVIASEKLTAVQGRLILLRGPAQIADEAAFDALEALADPDTAGYNHLFDSSAVQTSRNRGGAAALPQRQACGCDIGLIDTGVATTLANFKHVKLTQRAFNAKTAQPRLHGTAVAHLMAGTKANSARPTKIFVADIFSGPRETAGSSFALIKAMDWLAVQGVPVINVSLSGPRNPAVASAIARVIRRGHVVVAAAGNDGPAAPPVFPGAYDDVLGVTAVDVQNRVYRYANRGAHVDFAARGVAVTAIDASGGVRDATGTSFAAPVIAARLAGRLRKPDPGAAQAAIRALEAEARDLGPRGRDPIYGAGLIGEGS